MFNDLCSSIYAWCKADKNRSLKYSVIAVMFFFGTILALSDYRQSANVIDRAIERNSYGQGIKKEELEIQVNGNEREEIELEISEQMYEGNQIDVMFQRCISKISQEMLGDNKSLDYVTSDLNLITELDDEPVTISWKLKDYSVMNIYGEIQEENVTEQGTLVLLEALLTYTENQERQMVYECAVKVYPKTLSETEKFLKKVESEIREKNNKTRTEKLFVLPENVDGKRILYFRKMDMRGVILIVMAVIMGVLFYVQELNNRGEELKKRGQQMLLDYPEIVNKLTLFLGAGMTVKRAFRKVVSDYEEAKDVWGIRYAYEEMKVACREMESGFTEAESYERFGRHCGIQEYIRLGALLSQNMKKGNKGLSHILRLEALQAFENRKARAKKLGEEAGTKLLIPMFIMFAVVLVMIMIPAFLTMQI